MSFYWIYMGDPVQPMLQPMVTGSVLSPKMSSDCVPTTTPMLCGKVLPQSTIFLPNEAKSNWTGLATMSQSNKLDISRHFPIFVGDLSPELDTHQLQEAFAPFGQTSDCKIIRDQQTLKSKGYGFVSFVNKEDAEKAIGCMNGQWLGSRPIRTNWAIRKPALTNSKDGVQKALTYEEVFGQTSSNNCTVYCGGIVSGLSDELMHQTFGPYGCIQDIRVFKEKGYAFIRFSSKESASRAIVAVHGSEVSGQTVKCSWGREPNESSASGTSPNQPLLTSALVLPPNYNASGGANSTYYTQLGYWNYANNYNGPVTHPGFVQPYLPQGYTYGNYCRVPTVQWSHPNGPATTQATVPVQGNQQPTILAYQPQPGTIPGFQQA